MVKQLNKTRPFRLRNTYLLTGLLCYKLATIIIKNSVNERTVSWSLCGTALYFSGLSCYSMWFYWFDWAFMSGCSVCFTGFSCGLILTLLYYNPAGCSHGVHMYLDCKPNPCSGPGIQLMLVLKVTCFSCMFCIV